MLWTTGTQIAVMAGIVILSGILARRGAGSVFEPYNLGKRVAATMLPLITIGLTTGAVRFIARAKDENERRATGLISIVSVVALCAAISITFALFPELAARILVGDADVRLMWAVWLYSVALAANGLVYAFYRAEIRQTRANWESLLAVPVIPLVVVVLAPTGWDGASLLAWGAVGILVMDVPQLASRVFRGARAVKEEPQDLQLRTRSLMSYSVPRIPAGFALAALVMVGPWIARRAGMIDSSAMVLAALAVGQMAGGAVQSMGVVLLPRVSELEGTGRRDQITVLAEKSAFGALALSVVSVPLGVALAPTLVPLWLGPGYGRAVGAVQVVMLGVPAVVLFTMLRNIADGLLHRPVNTYASLAGLAVGVGLTAAVPASEPAAVSAGWVLGQTVAAVVVLVWLTRALEMRVGYGYLGLALAVATLGSIVPWLIRVPSGAATLAWIVAWGVVGIVGTLAVLYFSPSRYGFRGTVGALFRRAG